MRTWSRRFRRSQANVNSLTALESVNVRSGPGKSNDRVFLLVAGESVTVSEMFKGWLHVTDEKNREGWAYGESFDATAVAAVTAPEATDVAVADDSGVEVATETDVAPPAAGTAKVLGPGCDGAERAGQDQCGAVRADWPARW